MWWILTSTIRLRVLFVSSPSSKVSVPGGVSGARELSSDSCPASGSGPGSAAGSSPPSPRVRTSGAWLAPSVAMRRTLGRLSRLLMATMLSGCCGHTTVTMVTRWVTVRLVVHGVNIIYNIIYVDDLNCLFSVRVVLMWVSFCLCAVVRPSCCFECIVVNIKNTHFKYERSFLMRKFFEKKINYKIFTLFLPPARRYTYVINKLIKNQ